MNTNNKNARHADTPKDIIVLGVASIETKGETGPSEGAGDGVPFSPGISEE
ncbi:benenodin family lasso peptide [Pseudoxanthomonas wuyuanensis]